MKLTPVAGSIIVAVGGIVLASWGFSDTCSTEIVEKVTPLIGSLPGLVMAWFANKKATGANILGVVRK